MVVQAGTHRRAALRIVEQRSRDVALRRFSDGSVVPEIATVPVLCTVTNILLRDVGTEVENGPAS